MDGGNWSLCEGSWSKGAGYSGVVDFMSSCRTQDPEIYEAQHRDRQSLIICKQCFIGTSQIPHLVALPLSPPHWAWQAAVGFVVGGVAAGVAADAAAAAAAGLLGCLVGLHLLGVPGAALQTCPVV